MNWMACLLSGLLVGGFGAQTPDAVAAAKATYAALAVKASAGDTTVDWRALRLAAVTAHMDGEFDWQKADQASQMALSAGKVDLALKYALEITQHNTANANGHYDAYLAYHRMDKTADMARERAMVEGILGSIAKSGDGKSAATAYFTVTTSEEYIFLELMLLLHPHERARVQQDGHSYDKITVTDVTDKEQVLWFQCDTDAQAIAK